MVKSIFMKNFKKFDQVTVDLPKTAKVIGPNGMGKTSFIQAMRWALLGEFDASFIRDSSTPTVVEIEFDEGNGAGTLVHREYFDGKNTVSVNGKSATVKAVDELCLNRLGCSREVASAMFDVKDFESYAGNAKEFCKFLLAFLPVKMKAEAFWKFMQEANGREFSDDEKSFLETILTKDTYTIADIDVFYKMVYDQRRDENRKVKELKPKAEFDLTNIPSAKKEDLTAKLQTVLSAEKNMAEYQQKIAEYNRAVQQRDTVLARKKSLEDALKQYETLQKPEKSTDALRADLLSLQAGKEAKMREKAEIDKALAVMGSDYNALDQQHRTLVNQYNGFKVGNCPLIGAPCVAPQETKDTVLNKLKSDVEEIIAKKNAMIADGNTKRAQSNALAAEMTEIAKQIEVMNAEIGKVMRIEQELTKKDALAAELGHLVIPDLPAKPEEIKVDNLVAEKNQILAELAIYEKMEEAQKFQKEYVAAVNRAALLQLAVELFDPGKGVKGVVLHNVLKPLEKIVNENGYTVSLLNDGEFKPMVELNGTMVPMKTLSSGEFIMVAYQFMVAIHTITGVKILVIDNIDKLDKDNTELLMKLVEKDDNFDNVIICGVNHEDNVVGNITF